LSLGVTGAYVVLIFRFHSSIAARCAPCIRQNVTNNRRVGRTPINKTEPKLYGFVPVWDRRVTFSNRARVPATDIRWPTTAVGRTNTAVRRLSVSRRPNRDHTTSVRRSGFTIRARDRPAAYCVRAARAYLSNERDDGGTYANRRTLFALTSGIYKLNRSPTGCFTKFPAT